MALEVLSEHQSLWAPVICSKFGQIGNLWAAANVQQAFHRSSWKGIVQVMPSLIPFSKFSLGSGSSIRFWLDPWIYSIPLESRFPRLFNLSILKDGLVSSFFSSPLTGISTFGETSVTQKFKNLRHFLISFINFSPLPLVLTSELDRLSIRHLSVSSFFRAISSHPFTPLFPVRLFGLHPKFKAFSGN